MGISVWILTGDNQATAEAVAATVGIGRGKVMASVLPADKARKVGVNTTEVTITLGSTPSTMVEFFPCMQLFHPRSPSPTVQHFTWSLNSLCATFSISFLVHLSIAEATVE